jgi:hypothetical protein
VNVIVFVRELPPTLDGRELGRQLLRAALARVEKLMNEADQLTAIFTASLKTAKGD